MIRNFSSKLCYQLCFEVKRASVLDCNKKLVQNVCMIITETTVLMRVGEKERLACLNVYLPSVDYELILKSLLFLAWRSAWSCANKSA